MSLLSSTERLPGNNKRSRLQSPFHQVGIPESVSFQEGQSTSEASTPADHCQPESQVSTTNRKRQYSPDDDDLQTPISTSVRPCLTMPPDSPPIEHKSAQEETPKTVALNGHRGEYSLAQPMTTALSPSPTPVQPNTFALTSVPPVGIPTDNTDNNQPQLQPELCICYECLVLLRRALSVTPSNEAVPQRELLFYLATHPHLDASTELPLPRDLLALERFIFEPRWLAPSIVSLPDGMLSITPRCLWKLSREYRNN